MGLGCVWGLVMRLGGRQVRRRVRAAVGLITMPCATGVARRRTGQQRAAHSGAIACVLRTCCSVPMAAAAVVVAVAFSSLLMSSGATDLSHWSRHVRGEGGAGLA